MIGIRGNCPNLGYPHNLIWVLANCCVNHLSQNLDSKIIVDLYNQPSLLKEDANFKLMSTTRVITEKKKKNLESNSSIAFMVLFSTQT